MRTYLSSLLCLMNICSGAAAVKYPATECIAHSDIYHGVEMQDPYQWLEEDARNSQRVRDWIKAQNEVTFGYLRSIPQRAAIYQRLSQLWSYEKIGTPWKIANRYFVYRKDGLENHSILYTMDQPKGPRKVLLNPNQWSKDGTVALGDVSISPDAVYAAYSIQEAGSDWRTWKIRDIETGRDLADELRHLKFTSLAWTADSRRVYYAKYPAPDPNQQFVAPNQDMKVLCHALGSDPAADKVIYYQPEHPEWCYGPQVTDDGRYLIITIHTSTDPRYRITYFDLSDLNAAPVELISTFENDYTFIDNEGPIFYFVTDKNAPNRRLIAIDTRRPQPEHWKQIVAETSSPLVSVSRLHETFICVYLEDVTSRVRLFAADGKPVESQAFATLGTIGGFSGKNSDAETFYSYQSMTTPPSIYRFDLQTGRSELLEQTKLDFNCNHFVSEQVFFKSKDGTRIPMFIAYKKGLVKNSGNPALLYGYGGFEISLQPHFSSTRILWMEMGGVFAMVNLRGGGEYGKTWHLAGKQMNKQNVFDDFIAAAGYLTEQKYTAPEKLAIQGGSNGGLLVGACLTQRPDLFAAAIPMVGVMDMLRYDRFTSGRFWVDEFGSANESKQMFDYLKRYSPYHNIKDNTAYPATLIMTADTDDRVVPGHSFKFAARLQRAQQGGGPVLIRVETRAGHGSGTPTSLAIEETADIYAFLAKNLRISYPNP